LKFGLYDCGGERPQLLMEGEGEKLGNPEAAFWFRLAGGEKAETKGTVTSHDAVVQQAFEQLEAHHLAMPGAVGHRIVHGGRKLRQHCLLTAEVEKELENGADFAPLHVPAALKAIAASKRHFPEANNASVWMLLFTRQCQV
jgi:acetate kinase